MSRLWPRLTLVLAVLVVGSLTVPGPASAQTDAWSFLVTPQLWTTHIEKNGFAAGPGTLGNEFIQNSAGVVTNVNPFGGNNTEPVDWIYPQWGIQLAAQKGRLTIAGAFQRVDFETRSDVISAHPRPFIPIVCNFFVCGPGQGVDIIQPGQVLGKERVSVQRMDVDLAVSYAFPDIVPRVLDLSLGVGVKAIYAEATRRHEDLGGELAFDSFFIGGLYAVCPKDDVTVFACRGKSTVHTTDWIYGLTIPVGMTVHLGDKWLMPMSISPFIGGETRDDHDVVYRLIQTGPRAAKVDRLDGTTLAYGVTADVTLRYLLNDALSVYAGGRVQYIKGHEEYLAYGPIVGMSVRFGGK